MNKADIDRKIGPLIKLLNQYNKLPISERPDYRQIKEPKYVILDKEITTKDHIRHTSSYVAGIVPIWVNNTNDILNVETSCVAPESSDDLKFDYQEYLDDHNYQDKGKKLMYKRDLTLIFNCFDQQLNLETNTQLEVSDYLNYQDVLEDL